MPKKLIPFGFLAIAFLSSCGVTTKTTTDATTTRGGNSESPEQTKNLSVPEVNKKLNSSIEPADRTQIEKSLTKIYESKDNIEHFLAQYAVEVTSETNYYEHGEIKGVLGGTLEGSGGSFQIGNISKLVEALSKAGPAASRFDNDLSAFVPELSVSELAKGLEGFGSGKLSLSGQINGELLGQIDAQGNVIHAEEPHLYALVTKDSQLFSSEAISGWQKYFNQKRTELGVTKKFETEMALESIAFNGYFVSQDQFSEFRGWVSSLHSETSSIRKLLPKYLFDSEAVKPLRLALEEAEKIIEAFRGVRLNVTTIGKGVTTSTEWVPTQQIQSTLILQDGQYRQPRYLYVEVLVQKDDGSFQKVQYNLLKLMGHLDYVFGLITEEEKRKIEAAYQSKKIITAKAKETAVDAFKSAVTAWVREFDGKTVSEVNSIYEIYDSNLPFDEKTIKQVPLEKLVSSGIFFITEPKTEVNQEFTEKLKKELLSPNKESSTYRLDNVGTGKFLGKD